MEEINARFEIIELAVKVGDYNTIDIQVDKLKSLSLDDNLNEIIKLLETKNFRQALYDMKNYTQSLKDDFFEEESEEDRISLIEEPSDEKEPQNRVSNLETDISTPEDKVQYEDGQRVITLEDLIRMSPAPSAFIREYNALDLKKTAPSVSVAKKEIQDTEKNVEPENLSVRKSMDTPRNEQLSVSASRDELMKKVAQKVAGSLQVDENEDEAFRDEETKKEKKSFFGREKRASIYQAARRKFGRSGKSAAGTGEEEAKDEEENVADSSVSRSSAGYTMPSIKKRYPPISYIGQKYRNMINQFPPLESSEPICPEVMKMQEKISKEGYTEEEIGLFLKHYEEYKERGEKDKAAQILLLAAATESKFAQFLLARELFRGDVLQRDHAESFTQINSLADQNFAEAICDLGQFYEYGIGIEKDKQMALLLYEEAAEMNVARARKHYERLKNSRGIMGLLKKIPSLHIGRKR